MPDRELAMVIPTRMLVAAEPFGRDLSAAAVGAAVARGLTAAGAPAPDLCPIEHPTGGGGGHGGGGGVDDGAGGSGHAAQELRTLLEQLDFDARMRAARALILCAPKLRARTLAGSVVFELATRARQSGVPAYAVTDSNRLEPFDARILDLQLIIQADGERALRAAGRKLAGLR